MSISRCADRGHRFSAPDRNICARCGYMEIRGLSLPAVKVLFDPDVLRCAAFMTSVGCRCSKMSSVNRAGVAFCHIHDPGPNVSTTEAAALAAYVPPRTRGPIFNPVVIAVREAAEAVRVARAIQKNLLAQTNHATQAARALRDAQNEAFAAQRAAERELLLTKRAERHAAAKAGAEARAAHEMAYRVRVAERERIKSELAERASKEQERPAAFPSPSQGIHVTRMPSATPIQPTPRAHRKCLRCSALFESAGPQNRMCDRCRAAPVGWQDQWT